MRSHGQTALEYLLIVVVVIIVVFAVFIWMQGLSGDISDAGSEVVSDVVCGTLSCETDADCNVPECGGARGVCVFGRCAIGI